MAAAHAYVRCGDESVLDLCRVLVRSDPMMPCNCNQFPAPALSRRGIAQRIRQTRTIKPTLTMLSRNDAEVLTLLQCPSCESFWQESLAWNWGGKQYVYRVPLISEVEWLAEPYVQPHEMLIYSATMSDHLETNEFVESSRRCRFEECHDNAIDGLVLCLHHHLASLRKVELLPELPVGRLFAPYHYGSFPGFREDG